RTRTYDMRGKKFCVVMAGNPYTESGEVFKIPDMLANRADIYNLGDVLGGMEAAFTLSYIENSLTSNPVLAPLATREMADLYLLVDRAMGKDVSTNGLSHAYSGAEINEITATLQRMLQVRDVVYKVNQQYIASAAQDDRYRTEPPFRLQGSYRNMNKLAEKISPVMNDDELQQLISDHYLGEA
ncbi:DNA repair protein, partial [Variovorax sp. 2RAF20]